MYATWPMSYVICSDPPDSPSNLLKYPLRLARLMVAMRPLSRLFVSSFDRLPVSSYTNQRILVACISSVPKSLSVTSWPSGTSLLEKL